MAAQFEREVRAELAGQPVDIGHPHRLLRLGRRRPGRGLPRAPRRPRRPVTAVGRDRPSRRAAHAPARATPVGDPHRRVRRPGARAAGRRARGRADVPGASRSTTSSSAATSRSPACSPAPTSPACSPTQPDGRPLPAARRRASRTALPRRHHARRPAPPVEVVATDGASLRPRPLRGHDATAAPGGRGRRPPERRQVHAGQPHRRPPRRDRRGEAGRHPRPQDARGRVERPLVHRGRHRRLARPDLG